MRRLTISVFVCLILTCGALAAQEGGASGKPKEKAKALPVDCSGVNDETITASVKEKISNTPSLKSTAISVETSGGAVTLKGTVKTGGLKGVATRMAKRVACVKKVDNQMVVEQTKGSSSGKNAKSGS